MWYCIQQKLSFLLCVYEPMWVFVCAWCSCYLSHCGCVHKQTKQPAWNKGSFLAITAHCDSGALFPNKIRIKQPVKLPCNFLSYLGACLGNLWGWWQWIILTASLATEETELSLHERELCNTIMSGVHIDVTGENYISQISSFKVQL